MAHRGGRSSAIDKYVGHRLKTRRKEKDLSQGELAESLNISFQQLQKYESGANRISSGRLYVAAKLLGVDITYFYQDIEPSLGDLINIQELNTAPSSNEIAKLNKAYSEIDDPAIRKKFLQFLSELNDK